MANRVPSEVYGQGIKEFAFVYNQMTQIYRENSVGVEIASATSNLEELKVSLKTLEDQTVLSMVAFFYGRVDQDFDKDMASKRLEADKISSIYGSGYGEPTNE